MLARSALSLAIAFPVFPVAGEAAAFAFEAPRQRLRAPGFRLPDLVGTSVGLEDYPGRVVLVHFWASFCAPCLEELPSLEALWRRYRDQGLVVVGLAADRGRPDVVRDFAARAGVSFPVLLDAEGAVRNRYEVVVLPTSYLIGRDGRFSARVPGAREWQSPKGLGLVESLLREREPGPDVTERCC